MEVIMNWICCLDVGNKNCLLGFEYKENNIKAKRKNVGGTRLNWLEIVFSAFLFGI
jgi:hypothetical protein